MPKKNNLLALFISLLAVAFSAWNVWAKDSTFCLTEACQVFDDFAVLGISLWFYSFVFFSISSILLILKQSKFVYILSFLALLGDAFLLALMMITAPCFNCLIIALFTALFFLSLHFSNIKVGFPWLFVIWLCLFIINVGALAKNATQPFAIYYNPAQVENTQNSSMRIYFSPSCTSCNELVNTLGTLEKTTQGDIAWYPVAENEEDIILIRQMQMYIDEGDNLKTSLEKTLANPMKASLSTAIPDFIMQLKILINQSHLNQRGTSRIPFVEYTGLPSHLKQVSPLDNLRKMSPNSNESTNPSFNLGVDGFCDQTSEEPC